MHLRRKIRSHHAYALVLCAMLYLSAKYNGGDDETSANLRDDTDTTDKANKIRRRPNYKSLPICYPNKTDEIVTEQPAECNVQTKTLLFYPIILHGYGLFN